MTGRIRGRRRASGESFAWAQSRTAAGTGAIRMESGIRELKENPKSSINHAAVGIVPRLEMAIGDTSADAGVVHREVVA